MDDILTARLRLVVMTPRMLEADASDRDDLAQALDAEVPSTWPPEHWEPHVLEFLAKQYSEAPQTISWNRYIVLRSPNPVVIGNINGYQKRDREAEIGYSVLHMWQGRGVATEAALGFLEELFREQALDRISAQTYPTLVASSRVLEKCGFTFVGVGDEEGTISFRLDRKTWEKRQSSTADHKSL